MISLVYCIFVVCTNRLICEAQFSKADIAERGRPELITATIKKHPPVQFKKIPVRARFFAYVQTGPGAYQASYTMGTGSFPRVKRPGRGTDHPPPTSAGVKNE
jgi:hypothetical protein